MGELSLDGSIKPINGALPMVLSLKDFNIKNFIIPVENAQEVAFLEDINIYTQSICKSL